MHVPPPEEDCKLAYCQYLFNEISDMTSDEKHLFFEEHWWFGSRTSFSVLFAPEPAYQIKEKWRILSYWDFVCQMTEYLHQPHYGDCTKQACSCDRCGAEEYFPNEVKK